MNERSANLIAYEVDFHGWAEEQATRLRAGDWQSVDVANVAEELEILGRSEASALRPSLRLISMHLLKLPYQSDRASRSWRLTVEGERINVERSLSENPSLKPRLDELFRQAYADARRLAAAETCLRMVTFPAEPPFTLDQVLEGEVDPG